jgi:hypothetical protein
VLVECLPEKNIKGARTHKRRHNERGQSLHRMWASSNTLLVDIGREGYHRIYKKLDDATNLNVMSV